MDKYREQPEALARGNFFTDFSRLDLNKKYQASELLKFLRTKANVSDLLETNAQLIELIFRLASEEGNANFEVEMARGGFDTLGGRLDDTTAQLAQTIRLDDSNLSLNNFKESDRAIIQGLAEGEINAVLGEGNVRTENYADKSITANKLSGELTKSSTIQNLVDSSNMVEGGYYHYDTGAWVADANRRSSNRISCKPGDAFSRFTTGYGTHVTFYDTDARYITGVQMNTVARTFYVPNDASITSFRISFVISDSKPMVTKGSAIHNRYIPYNNQILSLAAENLDDRLTKVDDTNLFTERELYWGGYNHYETGNWVNDSQRWTTHKIDCKPLDRFYRSNSDYGGQVVFWDALGNYVTGMEIGIGQHSFYIPRLANITQFSMSFRNHQKPETIMIGKGDYIPNEYVPREKILSVKNINLDDKSVSLDKLNDDLTMVSHVNLLDESTSELEGYYSYETGEWVDNYPRRSSSLIPCKAGEIFSRHPVGFGTQVAYYNDTGEFVTGEEIRSATQSTFRVPNNSSIAYFRIGINYTANHEETMIVRGASVPSEYIGYQERVLRVANKNIENKSITRDKLSDDIFFDAGPNQSEYIVPFSLVENPVITKDIVTDRIGQTGVADPFIVLEKGVYHMFFEILQGKNPATDEVSDEIGHAFSHDLINWTYTKVVLSTQEHGHRSAYPNVFKVDGVWYMLPDVMGNVKLYRATNFPSDWELVDDLIDGRFFDTNLFKIDSNWYLTTRTGGRTGIDMYVNTSGDFKNTSWTLHPKSPIIVDSGDETYRRGGGKMIEKDGYVYYPVQTSVDGRYGARLYWYKLSGVSPTEVTSTRMLKLFEDKNDGSWSDRTQHHICDVDYLNSKAYAVDGHLSGEYAIGLYTDA